MAPGGAEVGRQSPVRSRAWRALKQVQEQALRSTFALLRITVLGFASYLFMSHFVLSAVVIRGRSMTPTLNDGDHCILNRWAFVHSRPKALDLVVLRDPGHKDLAVKRIIGMPGDSVLLRNGGVFVNNRRLEERYLAQGTATFAFDGKADLVVVAPGHYFVLGDNRSNSEDSRFYGPVSRENILGRIYR